MRISNKFIKKKKKEIKLKLKNVFNEFVGLLIFPIIYTIITIYTFLIVFDVLKVTIGSAFFLLIFCILFWYRTLKKCFAISKKNKIDQDKAISNKKISELLDTLNSSDTSVYHDIKLESFNLDHLILSKKGIFILETRSYFQSYKEEIKVEIKEDKLFVNGKLNDEIIYRLNFYGDKIFNYLSKHNIPKVNLVKVVLFPYRFLFSDFNPISFQDFFVTHQKGFKEEFDNRKFIYDENSLKEISKILQKLIFVDSN